jgi:hypothetical protein
MKREPGMAYDTKVLNKIFAVISVCFLLVTIWMVLDDYIRPWKAIQVRALDIEKQMIQERIKEIEGSIDNTKSQLPQHPRGTREKKEKKELRAVLPEPVPRIPFFFLSKLQPKPLV